MRVSRGSVKKRAGRNAPSANDQEEQILDAVDRLLARFGYRDLTMEDLSKELGMDKSPIYLSFRTKEDLLLSHVDRIVRQVVDAMEEIAQSDAPPWKKLRDMLVARVMLRFDSVQHYTESLGDIVRDLRFPLLNDVRNISKVRRDR